MASGGLGRCRLALGLALLLDGAGMGALLTGIFARLRVRGQDFGDLLIYSGAVLVFLSLLGWVLWYTGNLELAPDELGRDYGAKGGTLMLFGTEPCGGELDGGCVWDPPLPPAADSESTHGAARQMD
ncbi:transmembrane protein 238 [Chelonoidis abingdonii]|uniref:transmembrane protein 238 n=1 Tax=Chelonoidis abingdonii TaxID=106734 RepID=UPI003F492740